MKLRVQYERPDELLADDEAQFQKGGLLVRMEPPPGLQLFHEVELEIATTFAGNVVVKGQVVQLVPGAGVAVTFDPKATADLVERARRGGKPKPQHSDLAQRVHTAMHGNKEERMRVIRDINKTIHPYVLKNIGIGVDEVLAIAKMSTVAPDLLGLIAERKEWSQRPEIALALVKNPKTPTAAAIRLLDHVSPQDLRLLAKDTHTRPAVQQAARKRILS